MLQPHSTHQDTWLALSLASSAFLQCVPRSQAHGLQAVWAFLLSAAVVMDCPVPPLACQCKNTLHSHCVPDKGGSCRNSCGGCLIPVTSFSAALPFQQPVLHCFIFALVARKASRATQLSNKINTHGAREQLVTDLKHFCRSKAAPGLRL